MSKFVKTSYTTPKEILKFPDHHMSIAVTVDDAGISANGDGRKIVPTGTIVGGGFLTNRSTKVVAKNDATAQGVLRYDVDVTQGPAPGAAVIHGFVDLAKLPTAPTAEAITALNQITFLN